MSGTWTVDPGTLQALRLGEAQKAVESGELDKALIEAEELLDEDPSHPKALEVVSQAALGMGDVVMALEALNRFVELHTPDSRILHALAVARFQAVDYSGALAAAEQATALDKQLTAAWYYQGLALERMGRCEAAVERFKVAAEQEPEQFPIHPGWSEVDWDDVLSAALDRLPQPIQVFYDGIKIRFDDYPAVEDLLEHYPPLSPFTDAMYRGQPPKDADPWVVQPEVVSLFRGNLSRPSTLPDDIKKRTAEALMHEAMHWLGVSETPS